MVVLNTHNRVRSSFSPALAISIGSIGVIYGPIDYADEAGVIHIETLIYVLK